MRRALVAALAPPYFLVAISIATLLGPKAYRSASQTVSELAGPGAPHPGIISAGFVGYAALVQGLGPRLHREAGGGARGLALWGLVGAYGLGGILAGVFRTGSKRTVVGGVDENALHGAGGHIAFGSISSLLGVTPFLLRGAGWGRWRVFSWAMFAATCSLGLLFGWPRQRRRRGIFQRGFFATTLAWVLATSLKLAR